MLSLLKAVKITHLQGSNRLSVRRAKFVSILLVSSLMSSSLMAFDAGEHATIGNLAMQKYFPDVNNEVKNLEANISFQYGHLIAMAGDMYKSVEEIALDEPTYLKDYLLRNRKKLKQCIDKEIQSIYQKAEYEKCSETRMIKRKFRYLTLAHDNYSHFSWHNLVHYVRYHEKALWFAELAFNKCDDAEEKAKPELCAKKKAKLHEMVNASDYKKRLSKKYKYFKNMLARRKITKRYLLSLDKQSLIDLALFTNAFADHYLTDAFSAGHARVPRVQIDRFVESESSSTEETDERVEGSAVSGALTQFLHNLDGDLHGIQVKNLRGDSFLIRGDKQLFAKLGSTELDNQPDKNPVAHYPVSAVGASLNDIFMMINEGKVQLSSSHFSALDWVPIIDYQHSPTLQEQVNQHVNESGSVKKAMKAMSPEMQHVFRSQFVFEDESYKDYFAQYTQNINHLMKNFQTDIKDEVNDKNNAYGIPPQLVEYYKKIQ